MCGVELEELLPLPTYFMAARITFAKRLKILDLLMKQIFTNGSG